MTVKNDLDKVYMKWSARNQRRQKKLRLMADGHHFIF